MRIRVSPLILLVILVPSLAMAAIDEVTVQLKWIHQAQFAGFYTADREGSYQREGIDVTFLPGGVGIDVVSGISRGDVDFAVMGADSMLVARSRGIPLIAIATLYRINPFVLVAFADSGIHSPYDFVGRTVAITEGYNHIQFEMMMNQLDIGMTSINIIPYTYDDTAFLQGDVDVTVSFAAGSLLSLRQKTGDRPLRLFWPDDFGVHFYADTLVVHEQLAADRPDLVLRFLRATLAGHLRALQEPESAIDATMDYAHLQDRSLQYEMLRASIPLIHTGYDRIGWMRPEVWLDMAALLFDHDLLTEPIDVDAAFTLDFLKAVYEEDD